MTLENSMKLCLLCSSIFLSSCAYMQTHKNIEESFREHTGYQLSGSPELYRAGGHYYLAAEKQQIRLHYPVIHDSIFLIGNNEPQPEKTNKDQVKVYRRISDGTAQVLQLASGYADLQVLSDEINTNPYSWSTSLPAGARRCTTKATIHGEPVTWTDPGSASKAPLAARMLSNTDRVLIDWPGTVLYNVAIPVMAPFVFFYEFLNEK